MLDKDEYYHVVQHVFEASETESLGYEVLLRHHSLTNPEMIFKKARARGVLVELDLLSIMKFLQNKRKDPKDAKIFFNVFPSTLVSSRIDKLFKWIEEHPKENIVLEINESNDDYMIWESSEFIKNVKYAQQLGVEIAMDDVGRGQSSLTNIINVSPDYIKLDRFFGFNLSEKEEKKQMVSAFVNICDSSNISLVLEGLETKEDYEVAKELGVSFMQGYYLDIPKPISELANEKSEVYSK